MTILVNVGAGFIGSNCVLDWLAGCNEPAVKLDNPISYIGDRPGHDRRYAIDVRKVERKLV